jgi:hypothetical protein
LNVHPGTGCEVYLHRLGIGRGGGQMKRGLHILKYRIGNPSGPELTCSGRRPV